MVLEWDPIDLATADLISLSLYRNGQKAGNIPRPTAMHSTKISGLAVDTEYVFHLVLRTSAGTFMSEKLVVRTHKMTDLSGITITTGYLPASMKNNLTKAVERIGAKTVDEVRIDTTHFVTTEGRGAAWEKAVETNIPVVRPEWVEACEKTGRILGVTKFYLDAMRPGPHDMGEQKTVDTRKDLPQTPSDEARYSRTAQNDQEEGGDDDDDDDDEEEEDEEDEEDQDTARANAEQKAMAPGLHDEQKVRAEDMKEQKVALRSNTDVQATGQDQASKQIKETDDKAEEKKGTEETNDDDDDDDAGSKPGTTPDRASSFQEVEL